MSNSSLALPYELLHLIFEHAGQDSVYFTIRSVCRTWNVLCSQYTCSFSFGTPGTLFRCSDKHLLLLPTTFPQLTKLCLVGHWDNQFSHNAIERTCAAFPRLNDLTLSVPVKALTQVQTTVETLTISRSIGNYYTTHMIGCLRKLAYAFPNIKTLNFTDVTTNTTHPSWNVKYGARARTIAAVINRMPWPKWAALDLWQHLDVLDLSGSSMIAYVPTRISKLILDRATIKDLAGLHQCTRLNSISFKSSHWELRASYGIPATIGVVELNIARMAKCHTLADLNFSSTTWLQDEHLMALTTLTNLETLNVFGCKRVTDIALATLNSVLPSLGNLIHGLKPTTRHLIPDEQEPWPLSNIDNRVYLEQPKKDTCPHCGATTFLEAHLPICQSRTDYICVNSQYGCTVRNLTYSGRNTHLHNCEFYHVACRECGEIMLRSEFHEHSKKHDYYASTFHLNRCSPFLTAHHCTVSVQSPKKMEHHLNTYDRYYVTCKACNICFKSRSALEKHACESSGKQLGKGISLFDDLIKDLIARLKVLPMRYYL